MPRSLGRDVARTATGFPLQFWMLLLQMMGCGDAEVRFIRVQKRSYREGVAKESFTLRANSPLSLLGRQGHVSNDTSEEFSGLQSAFLCFAKNAKREPLLFWSEQKL
jgi:hypothetical protein